MCLIIHKKADATFSDDKLRDFCRRNDDGYGFLHVEEGRLHVHKSLGDADSFIRAFRERENKECLIHLRMRTHGHVDMSNTHPYEVLTREQGGELGPVWMMHNGVLSHGNSGDTAYSDTWHYIKNYLRPILTKCPTLLLDESFQCLVRNDIGSGNKFAFMTGRGDVVILNRQSGEEIDGNWFSNRYSWNNYSGYQGSHYQGYEWGSHRSGKYRGGSYQSGQNSSQPSGAQPSVSTDPGQNAAVNAAEYEGMGGFDGYDPTLHASAPVSTPASNTASTPASTPTATRSTTNGTKGDFTFTADASAFFQVLRSRGFDEAYKELKLSEVELAFEMSGTDMALLQNEIEDKTFQHGDDEGFIAAYVRSLAGLNTPEPPDPEVLPM